MTTEVLQTSCALLEIFEYAVHFILEESSFLLAKNQQPDIPEKMYKDLVAWPKTIFKKVDVRFIFFFQFNGFKGTESLFIWGSLSGIFPFRRDRSAEVTFLDHSYEKSIPRKLG